MLKSIELTNYKSFSSTSNISFESKKYDYLEQNTLNGVLRGTFIIGSNASGKTNLLKAIRFIVDLLYGNDVQEFFMNTCLFSDEKQSKVKYTFLINNNDIVYQIKYDKEGIIEEFLYKNGIEIIRRIKTEAIINNGDKSISNTIKESNVSFVRKTILAGLLQEDKDLKDWCSFIENSSYINPYERLITNELSDYLKKNGCDEVNSFLERMNAPIRCQLREFKNNGKEIRSYVTTQRKDVNLELIIELESLGNRVLLNILPTIIASSKKTGMLIMDEFNSGLHTNLEILLIKYILSNGFKSQLFFTSHCAGLISNTLFRPDQIFITEFKGKEGTIVKKVSDYKPRVFQNLQKMYLSGEFGGLPDYELVHK